MSPNLLRPNLFALCALGSILAGCGFGPIQNDPPIFDAVVGAAQPKLLSCIEVQTYRKYEDEFQRKLVEFHERENNLYLIAGQQGNHRIILFDIVLIAKNATETRVTARAVQPVVRPNLHKDFVLEMIDGCSKEGGSTIR